MASFLYDVGPDPIRADLVDAHRAAWAHIAAPGTWLTGPERVAVAKETRHAVGCRLCRERKAALSPVPVDGEHESGGGLPSAIVEQIHRITTDAARLSERWYRSLLEDGLTPEAYVEALGVAVVTISIDRFHRALGLALEPLPEPLGGEPSRMRPNDVVEGEAWVPMRSAKAMAADAGLPLGQAPFVIRALSLVPAEVRSWTRVSAAQYLAEQQIGRFEQVRAINRSQIELVAGRVSALNECFY